MSEKPQTGPNIQDFAKRIEEATSHIDFIGRDGKPRKRDYEDEARWFTAYQMAENMRADYTSKDWAHYVMEGMQPLTDEDVKDWFYDEDEKEWNWPNKEELIRWFHG
jgi:hypothetical protein